MPIFDAITKAMSSTLGPDSMGKLVAFAADGAAVKTGTSGGVIQKLRESYNSSIFMVKCMVHQLELAYKEVMKGPLNNKLITLHNGLYSYYHRSPLQRSNLNLMFDSLKKVPCIPARVGGTRWMNHTITALQKLWKGYRAFVVHLYKEIRYLTCRLYSLKYYILTYMIYCIIPFINIHYPWQPISSQEILGLSGVYPRVYTSNNHRLHIIMSS